MSADELLQDELVRAFAEGEVAGAPAPIERIDTHLSHVFLSGDRAFKLKRAVRLPFVDFQSREARRRACAAELSNQPMAAALYLETLPVIRDRVGFSLGGAGEAIDWVVVMRRFEQDQQFDRLAARGLLTRAMIEQAVEMIAHTHAQAPSSDANGHAVQYRGVISQLRQTEAHGARQFDLDPASPILFERLEQELSLVSHLIETRRKGGKVRRGHGDLHLRNMCLYQGKPLAFDALEFDPALATTDVLYDLAFLLMDLRHCGLAEHANAAMNHYWDIAGEDEDALALAPFFMSLRAAVRMAVAVEAGKFSEAHSYRALGLELLKHCAPRLVAIGGLSGTGKTAVAQALAPRLEGPVGARLLRSDVLRKTGRGAALTEKVNAEYYASEQRAAVYRDLAARAARALAAGASTIADATFSFAVARAQIAAAAGEGPFFAYWLDAPMNVRLARVAMRTGDASDADRNVAAQQSEPADLAPDWRRLNADRPVAVIVDEIARDCTQTADPARP